jgi:DNA-binding beta-propeller fold protein YncE
MISIVLSRRIATDAGGRPGRVRTLRQISCCYPTSESMYASILGSGEISRYQIAPDSTLALLGSTPVGQTGGVGAVDARLSPDGRYLYVDESRIGKVGAFAVGGGNLTELGTSPFALPAGATPAGIVVS